MDWAVKPVAVIGGESGPTVQEMLRGAVERWRPIIRIAGVIEEEHGLDERMCSAGYLRSVSDGAAFPLFRDLEPGAEACLLEPGVTSMACDAVCRDIRAGCDLVILSKFGKLEAECRGLAQAFTEAIEAGIPVLTSTSPNAEIAWRNFAKPMSTTLPAHAVRIDEWVRLNCSLPSARQDARAVS